MPDTIETPVEKYDDTKSDIRETLEILLQHVHPMIWDDLRCAVAVMCKVPRYYHQDILAAILCRKQTDD